MNENELIQVIQFSQEHIDIFNGFCGLVDELIERKYFENEHSRLFILSKRNKANFMGLVYIEALEDATKDLEKIRSKRKCKKHKKH